MHPHPLSISILNLRRPSSSSLSAAAAAACLAAFHIRQRMLLLPQMVPLPVNNSSIVDIVSSTTAFAPTEPEAVAGSKLHGRHQLLLHRQESLVPTTTLSLQPNTNRRRKEEEESQFRHSWQQRRLLSSISNVSSTKENINNDEVDSNISSSSSVTEESNSDEVEVSEIIPWSIQSLSEAGTISASSMEEEEEHEDGNNKECNDNKKKKTNHQMESDISRLVLDVARRLDKQITRLILLQDIVQQLKVDSYVLSDPEAARLQRLHQLELEDEQPPSSAVDDNSPTTERTKRTSSSTRLKRPYWWTYSQENRLQEELDSALKNIESLLKLHEDTQSNAMDLYRHWSQAKNDTNVGTTNNSSSQNKILLARMLHKTCSEIHARHALTIEQMSSLIIGSRPLVQPLSLYRTTIDFLKARLMIQLLCDHITSIGKRLELEYEVSAIGSGGTDRQDGGDTVRSGQRLQSRYNSTTSSATLRSAAGGAVTIQKNVKDIVDAAINEASTMCEAHFLTRPPVYIVDSVVYDDDHDIDVLYPSNKANEIKATFIRPWLQYTLNEVLKNAFAVTIENPNPSCTHQMKSKNSRYKKDDCSDHEDSDNENDEDEETLVTKNHCPVYVSISETADDVLIQIIDQGGGFREGVTQATLFAFAQCCRQWDRLEDQQTYAAVRSPLRGLGVGLSLSKMQMQEFGGDLILHDRVHGGNNCQSVVGVIVNDRSNDDNGKLIRLERGVTTTIRVPRDTTFPSSVS